MRPTVSPNVLLFTRRTRGLFSCLDVSRPKVGRLEEDDEGADGEPGGEEPEAQSIDDLRDELPFVRLLAGLVVLFDLVRHEPQLGEDRQKLVAQTADTGRHDVIAAAASAAAAIGSVRVGIGGRGLVARRTTLFVDGDIVVDVLDVRDETGGRGVLLFQLAHLHLLQQQLSRQRVAWARHPQNPGEPLADDDPYLEKVNYSYRKVDEEGLNNYTSILDQALTITFQAFA